MARELTMIYKFDPTNLGFMLPVENGCLVSYRGNSEIFGDM